ncbi:MAG TPA: exosortase system-associated protein, TIGR04073 family [Geobacteraceae bacterium]|nr:exosortase system-associated protein, TIGR04073 family [Geobacteraceae bacterium]
MGVKRCCMAFLVCLAMMAGHGRAAQADSYRNIENSSPQEVVDGMMNKAGRGMANMTTGWMELPKQIYETSRDEGAAKGASIGFLKGMGMMMARTLAGVGEFATFFVAYPGFFDPYFDPAYVWQKE